MSKAKLTTGSAATHAVLDIGDSNQDFSITFAGSTGVYEIYARAESLTSAYVVQHNPVDGFTILGVVDGENFTELDQISTATLAVITFARTLLGKPYDEREWLEPPNTPGVGIGPDSYTCCGLTSVVYGHFGITLHPYNVADQYGDTVAVDEGGEMAGDLVFFHWNLENNPQDWNHVALLIDSHGALINADSEHGGVVYTTVAAVQATDPGCDVEYRRTTLGYVADSGATTWTVKMTDTSDGLIVSAGETEVLHHKFGSQEQVLGGTSAGFGIIPPAEGSSDITVDDFKAAAG